MDKLLSVIMPVYNEGAIIREGVLRTARVLQEAEIRYELILVDDGSRDDTWPRLTELAADVPGVLALRLSRNFGKEGAMAAGLDRAQGDCVAVMDCDMQHPPEVLPQMYRKWCEGAQVVEGVKQTRGKESRLHTVVVNGFYGLLKSSSGIDLLNASDFRLLDRAPLEAWKRMPERQTFFRAMSTWVGYTRAQVFFDVAPRAGDGPSKFPLRKLLSLALHAITSFSAAPLQLVTMAGVAMLLLFGLLAVQTLYMKLSGRAVEGFTTVILLLLIIGGVLMIGLGIIGLYIAKIYEEVKGRPRYLVQEEIGQKENR